MKNNNSSSVSMFFALALTRIKNLFTKLAIVTVGVTILSFSTAVVAVAQEQVFIEATSAQNPRMEAQTTEVLTLKEKPTQPIKKDKRETVPQEIDNFQANPTSSRVQRGLERGGQDSSNLCNFLRFLRFCRGN